MKKYIKFLLIILLMPTITKPIDYKKTFDMLTSTYPLSSQSICRVAAMAYANLNFLLTTENQSYFKNASIEDTAQIKQTAKELGFSNAEIENINVKVPKKSSVFSNTYANNFASFYSTIILGRPNTTVLKEALEDPKVKKFIYAHELSHTKYNHCTKKIIAIAATAISIELFAVILRKAAEILLRKPQVMVRNQGSINLIELKPIIENNLLRNYIQKAVSFLTIMPIKTLLQTLSLILISKKIEKEADLSAASLGTDSIEGGIKFLETLKKEEDMQEQAALKKLNSPEIKVVVWFSLFIKKITHNIFSSHPSHEARIKYLKDKLLEVKNSQAKQA